MIRQSFLFLVFLAVCYSKSFTVHHEKPSGLTAAPGQFPFVASIRTVSNVHFCSGFIVSEQWVTTVAHCSHGRTPGNTRVIVGVDQNGGINVFSSQIVNHPNYNPTTLVNDVALIRTRDIIIFNDYVRPISLSSELVPGNVPAISVGSRTDSIAWFYSTTISNYLCEDLLPIQMPLSQSSLCAIRTPEQSLTIHSADVLVVGDTAAGIHSWTIPNNQSPDIYTRISSFREWILQIIE